MRKRTCPLHYGAGVVAALLPIEWACLISLLFGSLEVWDAVNGNPSWWDWQEYVCAFIATKALVLGVALIFGTPVCEVC